MRFRTIELAADPECKVCGTREITTLQDYDAFCGTSSNAMNDEIDDAGPGEIAPLRLDQRLKAGEAISLIDVREPYEWAIARIGDARLIPLNSLPQAVNSLSRDANIVVYCHHGARSDAAAQWLGDQGFTSVLNLVGGIDRWSLEVDASVRRY